MFVYFEDNYSWHTHFHMALLRGGNINEIDQFCRHLKDVPNKDGAAASQAWFEAWSKLAGHWAEASDKDAQKGHARSSAHKAGRASIYYFTAEKMLPPDDARKELAYDAALDNFHRWVSGLNLAVERVEVPFGNASLPALFVPAMGNGPAPCLVHLNGYDGVKEIVYQRMGDELRQRGISLLIVDQPGTGEALRKRGLHLDPASEHAASACVDYLLQRSDVKKDAVGVIGVSLGSYHAARAAAFEPRFACCIAWGGYWTPRESHTEIKRSGSPDSLPSFHRRWVTGQNSDEGAAAIMTQLTLEDAMHRVTCPLLVIYGEADRLVPRHKAEKQVEAAVNTSDRTLKVFTAEEGGVEHVQNDNSSLAVNYIGDWVEKRLKR